MSNSIDRLAGLVVITGASSGIGLELTRRAARDGVDLILVADRDLPIGKQAAMEAGAASAETVECDLSTPEGIHAVIAAIGGRPVTALFANAGAGQGGKFLEQEWDGIAHTLQTNVTGTIALVHTVGRDMVARDAGRILVTGSIVGHMPGPFNLMYNSTKSFIDFFCVGLANELKDSPVTVTCLLPGLTNTEFFSHAGMENTAVGQSSLKADSAKVAGDGYDAMLEGETQIVSGVVNKVQTLFADILPDGLIAEMHRHMAKPRD